MHGAQGADIEIPVPLGTVIRRKDALADEAPLAELLCPGPQLPSWVIQFRPSDRDILYAMVSGIVHQSRCWNDSPCKAFLLQGDVVQYPAHWFWFSPLLLGKKKGPLFPSGRPKNVSF